MIGVKSSVIRNMTGKDLRELLAGGSSPGERTAEEDPTAQEQATAGEESPPWPEDRWAI
jgi:hypothetical protein